MNLPRIGWLSLCVGLGILFLGLRDSQALTLPPVFYDDFSDGDPQDGNPVTWETWTDETVVDALTGDLVLSRNPLASPRNVGTYAQDHFLFDTSLRTQFRISGDGVRAGVQARRDIASSNGYSAGLNIGTGNLFIEGGGINPLPTSAFPFDYTQKDLILQFDVIGSDLSLWAWGDGDPMPEQPQIYVTDDMHVAGHVDVWSATGPQLGIPGNSQSIFRYVRVDGGKVGTIPQSPKTIYTAIDSDDDNQGNTVTIQREASRASVGAQSTAVSRLLTKFELPGGAGSSLGSATLRFFLEDKVGIPAGPVSLFHSVSDNEPLAFPSDYEDPSYEDTSWDLVQTDSPDEQYYELDVTEQVLDDYAEDGDNPFSAFRLQIDDLLFVDDDQEGRYRFTMPGAEANHPELVLTFIPEPSTTVLAIIGLLSLLRNTWRRNR